jgi:hypothetical protein
MKTAVQAKYKPNSPRCPSSQFPANAQTANPATLTAANPRLPRNKARHRQAGLASAATFVGASDGVSWFTRNRTLSRHNLVSTLHLGPARPAVHLIRERHISLDEFFALFVSFCFLSCPSRQAPPCLQFFKHKANEGNEDYCHAPRRAQRLSIATEMEAIPAIAPLPCVAAAPKIAMRPGATGRIPALSFRRELVIVAGC